MPGARIKGISVIHLHDFVREFHGEDAPAKVGDGLSPPLSKMFQFASAFEWYPLEDHIAVEARIIDLFYGGRYEEGWRIGVHDMEASIGTVYKIAFRFLGPLDVITRSAKLFSTFVDQGSMEIVKQEGERHFVVRFPGLPVPHPVYCGDLRGSIIGTLRCCGVKEPRVEHIECALKGASGDGFDVRW
jgi:hypothetical protein